MTGKPNWRKHEESLKKKFGGRLQPGSGNKPGFKGDIELESDYLIEAKETSKASYRVSLDVFSKVEEEAKERGKDPLLCLEVQGKRLVVCTEDVFLTLLEDASANRDRVAEEFHAPRKTLTISAENNKRTLHYGDGVSLCGTERSPSRLITDKKDVSCARCLVILQKQERKAKQAKRGYG